MSDFRHPFYSAGLAIACIVAAEPIAAQRAATTPRDDAVLTRASRTQAPLSVDDLLRKRSFTEVPITLSPDGRWVAYTLINPRRAQVLEGRSATFAPKTRNGAPGFARGTELWVTNTATGESRNITGERGVSWGGVWSPDSRLLAYYSDRSGVPQAWVYDVSLGRARQLSDVIVHPFYGTEIPQWTPDGRHLVIKVMAEANGLSAGAGAATTLAGEAGDGTERNGAGMVRVYRSTKVDLDSIGQGRSERSSVYLGDLALFTIATGRISRLVRETAIGSFFVSPAGNTVAYTIIDGNATRHSQDRHLDIAVVDIADGQTRILASGVPMGPEPRAISWSPDGRALAYCVSTVSKTVPEDCFVVSPVGGPPRNATPGAHPPFGNYIRGPLWNPRSDALYLLGNDTLWRASVPVGLLTPVAAIPLRELRSIIAPAAGNRIWSPDNGRSLYVRTRDAETAQTGVARIDLETGQATLLFEEDAAGHAHDVDRYRVDASGSTVVYVVERADAPEDLWIAGGEFDSRRRLTHTNPQLEKYVFGRSRLVTWQSLDGVVLRGTLLLPNGYVSGRRYPLVVWVYGGGSLSHYVNRFGIEPYAYNMQLLATRGYAVLAPDAPQTLGTPMLDLAKTVLPGVNKVIDLGIADRERLGVAGFSYGGYSTLALLVQTSRFRAAVSIAGPANLISQYGQLDDDGFSFGVGWAEKSQGLMRANPWERRDRYVENSPFFYLDRVTTPLLLIHGTLDQGVPVFGADEVFTALRRLGKDVVYAKYGGADHILTRSPFIQQRDYYARVIRWFGEYLGVPEDGRSTPGMQSMPARDRLH
jgi:dipeptidyl aminopeptidase/acylaminoacyl peptidase